MLTPLGFRNQRSSRPDERTSSDTAEVIAAVDLGSNSFHMKVAPVFAGGVAILVAIFDALGVKIMGCSDGALREGLLYDLIGRLEHHDVREATARSKRG